MATKFSAGDAVRIVKECPWGNVGDTGHIRPGTRQEPGIVNEDDFEWPTIDLLDGTYAYHVPESVLEAVEVETEESITRHPYTHACDLIRCLAGNGESGTKLSRLDASKIRQGIAAALGMDDHELACKLSDYYQAHLLNS